MQQVSLNMRCYMIIFFWTDAVTAFPSGKWPRYPLDSKQLGPQLA